MESKVFHTKIENPQWVCAVQPGGDWFNRQDDPYQGSHDHDIIGRTVAWLKSHAGVPGIDWAWTGTSWYTFKVYFRDSEMAAVFCLAHGIS